jgi:hypothetical protein
MERSPMDASLKSAGMPGAPSCSNGQQAQQVASATPSATRCGVAHEEKLPAQGQFPESPHDFPSHPAAVGNFGVPGIELHVLQDAPLDQRLHGALCLLENAMSVFDKMVEDDDVHPLAFPGCYLLRQAYAALYWSQIGPTEGAAVAAMQQAWARHQEAAQ